MIKKIILLLLVACFTFSITACGKEEEVVEEVIEQGEIKLDEEYVISKLTTNINEYLDYNLSFQIVTYENELTSDNIYNEIFYNYQKNYIVYDNTYNGGILECFSKYHYWNDGNNWYYDKIDKPECIITDYIRKIDNITEKKLLENTIINEQECYAMEVTFINDNNKETKIIYYVTIEDEKFVGIKENNLYSLILKEKKEVELPENIPYKESGM